MDPILDDLNPAQRDAVLHGEGPLMVIAGAGSGKTRVITRRIARLLRDQVWSSKVLALTFTNKAAGEMARRVEELCSERPIVSTFHSACARFLRRDGERLGYPRDYSIYDTYDRDSCVKLLMQERGLDREKIRPSAVGRRISQLKSHGVRPDDLVVGFDPVDRVVEAIFRPYEQLLMKLGALDFDDLLLRFLDLLREFPDLRESYQQRFEWVLVDEFQDTNRVQYSITKLLAGEQPNLCVVGDPDQSIYRFRGAEVRNILEFTEDFPETVTIKLETNYRSSARILHAAEGVIENNEQRLEKRLTAVNDDGPMLIEKACVGPAQEAREIGRHVGELLSGGVSPAEIAVFYRSHFVSRGVEEGFREFALPYQVVGGVSFFERREIKDLLAFLRVIVNPIDDLSMERIVNVPPRGIGKVTLQKLRDAALQRGMSLYEAVCETECRAELPPRARNALDGLAAAFDAAKPFAKDSAHDAMRTIAEGVGYYEHIGALGDPEDEARRENVAELHNDAAFFDREIGGGLAGYLQHVSLMTSQDRTEDEGPRVSLMTVHAAKGLEFDHVFVAGLEEGLFPSSRSIEEHAALEEERRLMYVALTRARRSVWLGRCQQRMVAGNLTRQMPSRFLDEIPEEVVTVDDSLGSGRRAWRDDVEIDESDDWSSDDGAVEYEFSQEADVRLESGTRVAHPVYGQGTVVELRGTGPQAKATVDFDESGRRILILEYTGLVVLRGESAW